MGMALLGWSKLSTPMHQKSSVSAALPAATSPLHVLKEENVTVH